MIYNNHGLEELNQNAVPLISHGFMPDASKLEADILNPMETEGHPLSFIHELHARKFCISFFPFMLPVI